MAETRSPWDRLIYVDVQRGKMLNGRLMSLQLPRDGWPMAFCCWFGRNHVLQIAFPKWRATS